MAKKEEQARAVPTKLILLVDSSGSMSSMHTITVEMLNQLIAEQKKIPGECEFQLVYFPGNGNDRYNNFCKIKIQKPLQDVRPLSYEDFLPSGGTPLYDAMVGTINRVKKELDGGPGRVQVIIVCITDGEGGRVQHGPGDVRNLVDKYGSGGEGWEFAYLGANQNASSTAKEMGIPKSKTMDYATTSNGVLELTKSLNEFIRNIRVNTALGNANAVFTAADREKAMQGKR